jgi:phosphohistidine phosphatase
MSASTDQNPTGLSVDSNGEKTLLIIRHAKSSWDIDTLSDFDRSLNDRGKRDAPMMAQRIKDRNILIDAFVASPAKRAKKTAEYFIETYGRNKEDIIFISQLYHAGIDVFFEVAQTLDDQFNTVAIFSHNPGITDFVNLLIKNIRLDNMPTCGIFAIKINDNSWKNFSNTAKEFLFFDYPKNS